MKNSRFGSGFLYVLPFGALVLFTTINFGVGDHESAGSGELSSGAFTMYIRMAIYGLALYPFFSNPKVHFAWLVKRWPLLLIFIYVPASILWSASPDGVIVSTIHLVGAALGAFAASIYFSRHHEQLFTFLSIVFGIPVIVSLVTVAFAPEIGLQNFKWEGVTRWSGSTGNANSLGRISALAVWANTVGLLDKRTVKKLKLMHIFLIIASITALIGSDSKTSQMISALLVTLVFLFPRIFGGNTRKRNKTEVFLVYALLLFVSTAIVFSDNSYWGEEAYSSIERDDTLSGRVFIWEDALTLIDIKPFIGWSFDGLRSVFNHIDIGVPHFHNGYLDVMVRGGMVGLVLFLIFLARTFWQVLRNARNQPGIYAPLLAFLLSTLLFNITEVTFMAWSDSMWTMVLLAYFLSERDQKKRKIRRAGIEFRSSLQ